MIKLINNLLDITKLDSGFIKFNRKNGDIVSVVENIVQSIALYVKSKNIELIFERFGQVNNSLSRQCEGTGIGLYLVKSFVEMHGGKISVRSMEGKGSEFTIELPAELVIEEDYVDKVFFETHVERIEIEFSDIYSMQG